MASLCTWKTGAALLLTGLWAVVAEAQEFAWEITLHVDHASRATRADGSRAAPYRTVDVAAQVALAHARAGHSARVLIEPGVYRETVVLRGDPGVDYATIKLEGASPGNVILAGADVVSGWSVGDASVFERTLDLPGDGNPMAFVEEARLLEVQRLAEVRPGTVYFDRGAGRAYLLPPKGGTVKDGTVEIGRREPAGIEATGVDRLWIESLAFERGFRDGIRVRGAEQVVINNCIVEYAQLTGWVVEQTAHARLNRAMADRCGVAGMALRGIDQLELTGCEANLNGASAPASETPGGVFIEDGASVTAWAFRVVENHGVGVRLSGSGGSARFDRLTLIGNAGSGLRADEGESPVSLGECQAAGNGGAGVQSAGRPLILAGCVLHGNAAAQLDVTGAGHRARYSIVVSTGSAPLVAAGAPGDFTGERNLYFAPSNDTPFVLGGERLNFSAWQAAARTDLNSFYGDPRFVDASTYDFVPKPDSPWYQVNTWPTRELN